MELIDFAEVKGLWVMAIFGFRLLSVEGLAYFALVVWLVRSWLVAIQVYFILYLVLVLLEEQFRMCFWSALAELKV